jgi:hypothetical protein
VCEVSACAELVQPKSSPNGLPGFACANWRHNPGFWTKSEDLQQKDRSSMEALPAPGSKYCNFL